MKRVKLSVVMPVYNELHTLTEIVRRIQSAPYEKELIIVDDCSSDGTRELIEKLPGENIKKIFHDRNHGKGGALRSSASLISGDIVVIQDADLEYHPDEYSQLVEPIVGGKADVVYGSRFVGAHRCFLVMHYFANKVLNMIANVLCNTILTDMMTGAKAFRADVFDSLPWNASGFDVEAEITGEIFKRRLRVYEVPISYSGRTFAEGKKIRPFDFIRVLARLVYTRFKISSVPFKTLDTLSAAVNYNRYVVGRMAPFLGQRILEIGSGIGNITGLLIKRLKGKGLVLATDVSEEYLDRLTQKYPPTDFFKVEKYDIEQDPPAAIRALNVDTVVCINLLEHIVDDRKALQNIHSILSPGGRVILLVPNLPSLFSQFDTLVGHHRRYSIAELTTKLNAEHFTVQKALYINCIGVVGWWINFCLLKRKSISVSQLWILNNLTGVIRAFDSIFKKTGQSLVVVAKKEER